MYYITLQDPQAVDGGTPSLQLRIVTGAQAPWELHRRPAKSRPAQRGNTGVAAGVRITQAAAVPASPRRTPAARAGDAVP